MGIGLGVVLIVLGAILKWAVEIDIPGVSDDVLGIILMVGGVIALVFGVVTQAQAGRTRTVVERRNDDPL